MKKHLHYNITEGETAMENLALAYNGYGDEIDDVLETAEEFDEEWMITNDITFNQEGRR